jgi:hypothetical protein
LRRYSSILDCIHTINVGNTQIHYFLCCQHHSISVGTWDIERQKTFWEMPHSKWEFRGDPPLAMSWFGARACILALPPVARRAVSR